MGCLLARFAGAFPRQGVLFIWLARPGLFEATFGGWLWPPLGVLFCPSPPGRTSCCGRRPV
jgi:hypothetical protein